LIACEQEPALGNVLIEGPHLDWFLTDGKVGVLFDLDLKRDRVRERGAQ